MQKNSIELFDTTLRDGTQGEGVNLSIQDKLHIAEKLDDFGIDIIEGGWPGSNPRDEAFFREVKSRRFKQARMCAFGSTARYPDQVASDNNLNLLLRAETPVISIFGKTWRFHSSQTLGLSDAENEELIARSVSFLKEHGREVIFDAEHFFDGYKDDPDFALTMLRAAEQAGADRLVLCDTNGGALTEEVEMITREVARQVHRPLGIHVHNDGELATANTLAAVRAGAVHVQGTINGIGERCGNANLCTVIPNLILKMGYTTRHKVALEKLTPLSLYVYERANLSPHNRSAFVGRSAFTHKGGIHVSSVLKDPRMYEHIDPQTVGNNRNVRVSDLSGQSNIRYKLKELGLHAGEKAFSRKMVRRIKEMEHQGYQFDGAEASFELLLRAELNRFKPYFDICSAHVTVRIDEEGRETSEAALKVRVGEQEAHTAADGKGPVSALDNALRKALTGFFPEIGHITLTDYKVRVLGDKSGTASQVRVLVESSDGDRQWSTVGVSHNIIQASLQALCDSLNWKIYHAERNKPRGHLEFLTGVTSPAVDHPW